MTNVLTPTPKQQFFGNDGRPAVGYKLFTYAAGTSTKVATYPNNSVSVSNANPVVLDYRGEANVWVPPNVSYKYVLATPTDTDPPGSPIWSVDNLVNNQLLTLYGGVDTGVANAYVLTFDASFDSYADGIVIYFIAGNVNTGASTINVNGLGPVAITTQGGVALAGGEIVASQVTQIMYKSGAFVLLYSSSVLAAVTAPQNTSLATGNYTLALTDQGKSIIMAVGVGRTLTIPPAASVNFPLGTIIYVESEGNADLSIARGAGVSLYELGTATDANVTMLRGVRSSATLYKYGANVWTVALDNTLTSYTGTLTGCTTSPTASIVATLNGKLCTLTCPTGLTATSNTTACTITGMPAGLRPANGALVTCSFTNNGAQDYGWATVSALGVITFGQGFTNNAAGFNNANSKGIAAGWSITYPLI